MAECSAMAKDQKWMGSWQYHCVNCAFWKSEFFLTKQLSMYFLFFVFKKFII
jgi:hypothetical protein